MKSSLLVRGSTIEELDQELSRLRAEIQREFRRYRQRECEKCSSTTKFINWLMRDETETSVTANKNKVHTITHG